MAFNTLEFVVFLAVVVALYYVLPHKARNPMLLAASYFFYACHSIPLVIFLVLCTLVNFFVARKVEGAEEQTRKRWLKAGLVLDVGVLALYKYLNFLMESVESLLKGASVTVDLPAVKLMVPLGISFIIFQMVSYLIDVYRGKISAEQRLFYFALYAAFFPKVVQGPITRVGDVLPQFEQKHSFEWERFREGCLMVLYGLFMKMVIADRAAVVVNTLYGDAKSYSGAAVLIATILFALQIYFDFAGYSLIAIGSAKLLGVDFKDNFRQPYLSASVGEFWRRWHMSLNDWLRDYVYIPLGGSRCSRARRNLNTLITFGLSGLWHGADWGYVIWGLLNGTYVVFENRRRDRYLDKGVEPFSARPRWIDTIVTFVLVTFAWVFFRAQNLSVAVAVLGRIFGNFRLTQFTSWLATTLPKENATVLGLSEVSWCILLGTMIVAWIIDIFAQKTDLVKKAANAPVAIRWTVFLVLIFAVIIGGMYGYGYSAGAFIYAQF